MSNYPIHKHVHKLRPYSTEPYCESGRFSAYFLVYSAAFLMNFFRSRVYSSARSPLSGCSGSGSCTSDTNDRITGGREGGREERGGREGGGREGRGGKGEGEEGREGGGREGGKQ